MNSAFPSRKMRDCELARTFCFWKPYKHTRKMAKVLSFQTIPCLYWKNDKGVKPANGFQPAFSGHSVSSKVVLKVQHLLEGKFKIFVQDFFPIGSDTKSSAARFSHKNLVEKFKIFEQDFVTMKTGVSTFILCAGTHWSN